jgi:trehalose 6-phosphate synthase
MSRLVTVSNRMVLPKGTSAPGGLAAGVLAAMRACGGLWFGDGEAGEGGSTAPDITVRDNVTFASIKLPSELRERYYSGFANGTLWPLFHYFLDAFHYCAREYEAYHEVNELFARQLQPLLREGDLVWVHDYHLIPLGQKLRALGAPAPIGFFLHVPFPHFEVLRALPAFQELMRALLTYDVVGFQTDTDRQAFLGAVETMWGTEYLRPDGSVVTSDHAVLTDVFPISVDVDAVAQASVKAFSSGPVRRMREGLLGRKLIIGVDRLDYSKGLLKRFEAYRHFLEDHPEQIGNVTYLQIAPLGRLDVKAYTRIRASLEQSAGQTNGQFADADWTPIRYLNRNFPHAIVMGFLRCAQVCLLTPVRDGMNLVAKEFIAAQDPADPGVLILSDRAGAAYELTDALRINPYDARAIAAAIEAALTMPLPTRRARHEKLLAALRRHDVHAWHGRFLRALAGAPRRSPDHSGIDLAAPAA